MNWEWRIFCAGVGNQLWRQDQPLAGALLTALGNAEPQVRPDFYHNVRIKECGLKERWEAESRVLELKVLESSRDGVELWTKLPRIALPTGIVENDGPDQEFVLSGLEQMRGNGAELDRWIDRVLQSIGLRRPDRIRINKKRSQCRARGESSGWKFQREHIEGDGAVIIESAEIRIKSGENTAAQILQSVCIEGADPVAIQRFVNEFVSTDSGQVMGYPKLILSL